MSISIEGRSEPKAGPLYMVERCADVFVDVCLRDEGGKLLLLSAFGRDTAIKELQARIHLGTQHQDGLAEMTLKPVEEVGTLRPQRVSVSNPRELEKLTGRLPGCVYGNLTHMWLFQPSIRTPQKGADVAWVVVKTAEEPTLNLSPSQAAVVHERIWASVAHLASIPLLPHWKLPVLRAIAKEDMLLRMGARGSELIHPTLSAPIGNFVVYKVQLDQQKLAATVTHLVRRRVLTLEPPGVDEAHDMERIGHVSASSSAQAQAAA